MIFRKTEVLSADVTAKYIGEIGSVPGGDGYGFININTVTKEDGSSHGLPTRENIFLHQDECDSVLRVGMKVEFSIATDYKRGEGNFRATGAVEFFESELLPDDQPIPGFSKALVLSSASQDRAVARPTDVEAAWRMKMKPVPAQTVAQVIKNHPMPEIPRDGSIPDQQVQLTLLMQFLRFVFPTMEHFAADFKILDANDEELDDVVVQTESDMTTLGFSEQIDVLREEIQRFKCIRAGLRMIFEERLVRPDTIVPIRYLPDIFMAVPVWFFWVNQSDQLASEEDWQNDDPRPHSSVKYFCDLFPGNKRWADTYQMFNRRLRTLKQYKGDVIPPHVTRRMRKAVELFDYVVIATPYHDVAGKDWQDIQWLRAIDPYVLGFKKGIPYFFVLARFSDTGLFPLFNELVADTIEFLKAHKQKLEGFSKEVTNPYWYDFSTDFVQNLGRRLIQHTDEMIQIFEGADEQFSLFDWLRGDNPPAYNVAVR